MINTSRIMERGSFDLFTDGLLPIEKAYSCQIRELNSVVVGIPGNSDSRLIKVPVNEFCDSSDVRFNLGKFLTGSYYVPLIVFLFSLVSSRIIYTQLTSRCLIAFSQEAFDCIQTEDQVFDLFEEQITLLFAVV